MTRQTFWAEWLFGLVIPLSLCLLPSLSCSKGGKPQAPLPSPQAPKAVQPATGAVTDVTANPFARSAEDVVHFRPPRDPFRSAYERVRFRREGGIHPLQRYNIQQLRLVGVIWGIPRPIALVTTPDGKEYQITEGTPVGTGDGRVQQILSDRVVIEERYYDYRGQLQTERFELVLKKE